MGDAGQILPPGTVPSDGSAEAERARRENFPAVRRVLVVKPSSLGDILHIFPALALLRRVFPGAELDYLVNPAFREILEYSPWPISRVLLFERKKLGNLRTFPAEFWKLRQSLRERKYDVVIDFQGLFRSAFFAWLARSRGGVIGFEAPREGAAAWFYRKRIAVRSEHAVERNLELVRRAFGIPADFPGGDGAFELPEIPRFRALSRAVFGDLPEKFIALVPGARWKSKEFPPELFAAVAGAFHREHPEYGFAVLGSDAERTAARRIVERLPQDAKTVDGTGQTSLGSMTELLRDSAAVLTNDSGPAHIAAALGKPVLTFFGPTEPGKTRPYGARCRYFRNESLQCLGCMERICPQGEPPLCHKMEAAPIVGTLLRETEK